MQISTIHKLQHALDTSKKVIKFVWRHAFVLADFFIIIQGICEGKKPILEGVLLMLAIAFLLDWIKMKIKFSGGAYNLAQEQMFESARRNMDSSSFGSSAWATNPAMAGSPANHLYNLGYNSTNYC